jgi:cytochrome c553
MTAETHTHHQLRRVLTSRPVILVAALVVIWGVLPLMPESSGLRFSWVYRIFFTAMALMAILFYWFFDTKPVGVPGSATFAIGGIIIGTVFFLVVSGVVYPTYPVPSPPVAVSGDVALGKQVYESSNVACYRCHMIAGKGGTRGPDLSHIATIAGTRVAGLSAAQYLTAKIEDGATYKYKVPKYVPSMVPYKALLSSTQIKQLVAYLLSLK